MTTTADLRRLAEQYAALDMPMPCEPQTILALLDERDQLDRSLDDRALLEARAEAAERRVAALEEGLRDVVHAWDGGLVDTDYDRIASAFDTARALLADAPDQLADLRQLVNEPGPVCDIPWAAGPANAMCLRCGNRFDEHTQAQPESEAGDD